MTEEQIRETFKSHKMDVHQQLVFRRIHRRMVDTTVELAGFVKNCRERSLFITQMQVAKMWLNTALAAHGVRDDDATI